MADEGETGAVEALEGAFGGDVPEPDEPAPAPAVAEPVEEEPLFPVKPEGEEETEPVVKDPAVAEPEYLIEVDGEPVTVKGAEQVKELLQKGFHYSKNSEHNARVREALTVEAQALNNQNRFQQETFGDLLQLQALNAQLQQYARVDWAAAYDTDPFNALKIREQRDQLREAVSAKTQELNAKSQQYQQGQAQAAQQVLAAQASALVAKVPEWRSGETATREQAAIRASLAAVGYTDAEMGGLTDHRAVIIARKAMLYDQLTAGKPAQLKQVRTAPPVVKPGAATQTNERGQFAKAQQELKRMGRNKDTRGQEALLTKMLNRTFK